MPLRDELVRAAAYSFPKDGTLRERQAAAEEMVRVHRKAPLIEYAEALREAGAIADLADVAAAIRTHALERELVASRRRLVLAEARIAAMEPACAP